jgi:hypothetical protein
MRAGRAVALVALGVSCACGRVSKDDCRAMTEHYLDLTVKESPGGATLSPTQAAAVREVERGLKRADPSYRAVQDHCEALTRAEVSCAIDAPTSRAWEACVHGPDAR